MVPTDEQLEAIELFADGRNLRINAFAGTGKTTTLQMLAEYSGQSGLYLAFNRSAKFHAAGCFPDSVACHTTPSLAFQQTPAEYRGNRRKMRDRINATALAQLLQLKDT